MCEITDTKLFIVKPTYISCLLFCGRWLWADTGADMVPTGAIVIEADEVGTIGELLLPG